MEVKELVELLGDYERKEKRLFRILIFPPSSFYIESRYGSWRERFSTIRQLENYLRQKPPDYKSLFSVVDGELHPDLQEFLRSLMEK